MGFVAIHTPTSDIITRMYGGFVQNYKYFRYVGCDVAMACASLLPADPLQVGVEAGSIAPQDMFNPILYKAVSNDSMSNIEAFMQGQRASGETYTALDKNSIRDFNDVDFKDIDGNDVNQFEMYYALLANSDGWRKAMPQAGLQMTGLYPIVFSMLSNYGIVGVNQSNSPVYRVPPVQDGQSGGTLGVNTMIRGNAQRLGRLPTTYFADSTDSDSFMAQDANQYSVSRNFPACYVAAIVLPPAQLNQLYYRLKITWTIEFSDPRPTTDIMNWKHTAEAGAQLYGTDYAVQSASMTTLESMVDTADADLKKIMEGS